MTVDSAASVSRISALMYKHRISGLPVVDSSDRVVGIVTEADLIARICARKGHAFRKTLMYLFGESIPEPRASEDVDGTAGDIMNPEVITAAPDDDIGKVAAILDEKKIKRLPVIGENGKLVGIVSRADIVRAQIPAGRSE